MKRNREPLLIGLTCVAFFVALVAAEKIAVALRQAHTPFSGLSLAVVLSFLIVGAAAKKRGLLAASVHALAIVPVLAFGASFLLNVPLTIDLTPFFPRLLPALELVSIFILGAGALFFGFASFLLGRVHNVSRLVIAFRALALLAIVLSAILFGFSIRKTRIAMQPDELVARITQLPRCLASLVDQRVSTIDPPKREEQGWILSNEIVVQRADFVAGQCDLQIDPDADNHASTHARATRGRDAELRNPSTYVCPKTCDFAVPELHVLFDDRGGETSGLRFAIHDFPFNTRHKSIVGLARNFAPPLAWTLLAICGGIAALLVPFASRGDRTLLAFLEWTEVDEGGVTMLKRPARAHGLYRGSLDPDDHGDVVPGSHRAIRERIALRAAGRWALAFAIVSSTATPLVVAAAHGFLAI